METLKINYNNNSSVLCELGKKYDSDCHPYTLFYDGLFKHKKYEALNIAKLGNHMVAGSYLCGESILQILKYMGLITIMN